MTEQESESRRKYIAAIITIVLGFLLMSVGGGQITSGMAQQELADEYERSTEGQTVSCPSDQPELCRQKMDQMNDNPYSGGGLHIIYGLILMPVGAAVLKRGLD